MVQETEENSMKWNRYGQRKLSRLLKTFTPDPSFFPWFSMYSEMWYINFASRIFRGKPKSVPCVLIVLVRIKLCFQNRTSTLSPTVTKSYHNCVRLHAIDFTKAASSPRMPYSHSSVVNCIPTVSLLSWNGQHNIEMLESLALCIRAPPFTHALNSTELSYLIRPIAQYALQGRRFPARHTDQFDS